MAWPPVVAVVYVKYSAGPRPPRPFPGMTIAHVGRRARTRGNVGAGDDELHLRGAGAGRGRLPACVNTSWSGSLVAVVSVVPELLGR